MKAIPSNLSTIYLSDQQISYLKYVLSELKKIINPIFSDRYRINTIGHILARKYYTLKNRPMLNALKNNYNAYPKKEPSEKIKWVDYVSYITPPTINWKNAPMHNTDYIIGFDPCGNGDSITALTLGKISAGVEPISTNYYIRRNET